MNTSFNLHEEPIVESPGDAFKALEQDAIDALFMPPYFVYNPNNELCRKENIQDTLALTGTT